MKKLLLILVALAGAYYAYDQNDPVVQSGPAVQTDLASHAATTQPTSPAKQWQSGDQVQGSGTVSRILSDDNDGSRHQRFILRLGSGQTLLIAHNIDLAPRVSSLRKGDTVSFYGVYETNAQGGVVHWTHRDPQGRHVAGWLEHKGRRYR